MLDQAVRRPEQDENLRRIALQLRNEEITTSNLPRLSDTRE